MDKEGGGWRTFCPATKLHRDTTHNLTSNTHMRTLSKYICSQRGSFRMERERYTTSEDRGATGQRRAAQLDLLISARLSSPAAPLGLHVILLPLNLSSAKQNEHPFTSNRARGSHTIAQKKGRRQKMHTVGAFFCLLEHHGGFAKSANGHRTRA